MLRKDAGSNLPSAAWLGKRFALTWYARTPGEKVSFEQKFALLEPEGEVVGTKFLDLTPVDGASSVMGRLRVGPPGTLGLVWQDDASGQRTATFRTLDFTGKPTSEPMALWKEKVPHADQAALAWNEKTKSWLFVFQGTEPTARAGYVTHHLFATTVPSKGAPLRLDVDESIVGSHGLSVEARGECGVTAWEASSKAIVLATFCGEKVQRIKVSDASAKAPTQPTLALRPDGSVLVAWVDEAPPAPVKSPPTPESGGGSAPSRPLNAPPPTGLPRRSVAFALVDASGTVKVRGRLDAGGDAEVPVVAAAESGWFVAWSSAAERKDTAFSARISPEGNQQGPLTALNAPVAGPTWVSLASRPGAVGVLISQPNDADCAVAWAPL